MPPRAVVQRPNWNLPPSLMWSVSVRIGTTWLSNRDGTRDFPALTGRHSLMFLVDQPIEGLLDTAGDVAVQTPDRSFEMRIPREKMRALVVALRKCTALIGRTAGRQ